MSPPTSPWHERIQQPQVLSSAAGAAILLASACPQLGMWALLAGIPGAWIGYRATG